MKVQVLLSLLILMMSSAGASQANYYCGRNLAEAVKSWCPQGLGKRSDLWTTQKFENGFWLHPQRAMKIGRDKRDGRGIAEECCNKPCTKDEILQYCVYNYD